MVAPVGPLPTPAEHARGPGHHRLGRILGATLHACAPFSTAGGGDRYGNDRAPEGPAGFGLAECRRAELPESGSSGVLSPTQAGRVSGKRQLERVLSFTRPDPSEPLGVWPSSTRQGAVAASRGARPGSRDSGRALPPVRPLRRRRDRKVEAPDTTRERETWQASGEIRAESRGCSGQDARHCRRCPSPRTLESRACSRKSPNSCRLSTPTHTGSGRTHTPRR